MAVKVETADLLKEYFTGVLERADDHAQGVQEICLALMGAVIWKSDGDIEVKSVKEGGMGNILWFNTPKGRYAMYYNHSTISVELRARNSPRKNPALSMDWLGYARHNDPFFL